jgi:hypothetical protein
MGFKGYTDFSTNHNTATLTNRLAIAILNSDAHAHVNKRGNYAEYSACHSYFEHRFFSVNLQDKRFNLGQKSG